VKQNYNLNGFTAPVNYFEADVFDCFEQKVLNKETYDIVMADPRLSLRGKKTSPRQRKVMKN